MKILHQLTLLLLLSKVLSIYSFSINDLHYSFWADYNQFNKKLDDAYQWYRKMITPEQEKPGYMYKGLLQLLHQLHQSQEIINLMPIVDASLQNDAETQLIFAQILEQTGHTAEAEKKILTLATRAKDNPQ